MASLGGIVKRGLVKARAFVVATGYDIHERDRLEQRLCTVRLGRAILKRCGHSSQLVLILTRKTSVVTRHYMQRLGMVTPKQHRYSSQQELILTRQPRMATHLSTGQLGRAMLKRCGRSPLPELTSM